MLVHAPNTRLARLLCDMRQEPDSRRAVDGRQHSHHPEENPPRLPVATFYKLDAVTGQRDIYKIALYRSTAL